jgi:hypothetical protein
MCAGRVPVRSDVPVEFAAGIRIVRLALAFQTGRSWRKPAVECTPQASSKRRNSSHCTCRCGSANHGGLTPAALANVRLCIANVAFCSEVRCAPGLPFSPANRHCASVAAGVSQPRFRETRLQRQDHDCRIGASSQSSVLERCRNCVTESTAG